MPKERGGCVYQSNFSAEKGWAVKHAKLPVGKSWSWLTREIEKNPRPRELLRTAWLLSVPWKYRNLFLVLHHSPFFSTFLPDKGMVEARLESYYNFQHETSLSATPNVIRVKRLRKRWRSLPFLKGWSQHSEGSTRRRKSMATHGSNDRRCRNEVFKREREGCQHTLCCRTGLSGAIRTVTKVSTYSSTWKAWYIWPIKHVCGYIGRSSP